MLKPPQLLARSITRPRQPWCLTGHGQLQLHQGEAERGGDQRPQRGHRVQCGPAGQPLHQVSPSTCPLQRVRGYRYQCLSAGSTSSTSTRTGSWRGRTCSPCPSSASTPSGTESSTHSSQKTRLSGTHRSCSSRQDRYTLMLPIIDQVDDMDLISRTLSTCWPTSDQFPINRGG